MECNIAATYRCNAKCMMCNIWEHPTKPEEEFKPELLEKLPNGLDRINLSGGEPMLRKDYMELVDLLWTKTSHFEISTNGFFIDRLVKIGKKYPKTRFRISIEGFPELNDKLRGIKNGFDHAIKTVLQLRQVGVKDVGFAMVVSDKNCFDLLNVYYLCSSIGLEFSTAVMHNSFFFQKTDNKIEDLNTVISYLNKYILSLLNSKRKNLKLRIKDWFRAYINLGLLKHIKGEKRMIPCGVGTDFIFINPYGEIMACNGSEVQLTMGDLKKQSFEEIMYSEQANKVRDIVRNCKKNCWMTGSARPAVKREIIRTISWVLTNKINTKVRKNVVFN